MWKQQRVKESIPEFLWNKNLSQYLCPHLELMMTSQPDYHFTHPSQLNMFSTDIHNHYKGTVIIINMILYEYDISKILLSYKKVSAI